MTGVNEVIERMRVAAGPGERQAPADREQLKTLAAQFESMLLVQMLRDMRQSGRWEDESSDEGGLGAETFFETLDVELANYLSRAKGLGLATELEKTLRHLAGPSARDAAAISDVSAAPAPIVPAERPADPPARGEHSAHTPQPEGTSGLRFGVAAGSITSSFGWRRDPFTGEARFHRGIDVRAAYGQEIQAAGDGRIVFSGEQRGYGTTVVVEHGNGVQTRYAHLSAAVVQDGERVTSGQVLGRAGRSGRATGTHLHFEVIKDGRHVSPAEAGLTVQKTG